MPEPLVHALAIGGLVHHEADVGALEAFRFPDEAALLADARAVFGGALLLQTCNRVELLVPGTGPELSAYLHASGRTGFVLREGDDTVRHLLEVACGLDSMIMGEDQILGQLRQALVLSRTADALSPLIEECVNAAVHLGVEARTRTEINRGAVSIGSAAVQLAEDLLGSLDGRHILVVGSGEMGMLVTQALAARDLTAIYVANRTHGRAIELARKIGGKAVRLDELRRYLILSDVVISCTSAPHPVLKVETLKEVMRGRCWPLEGAPRPLILIDIAQPRDVEEGAERIAGVHLCTIDNLRAISEQNMETRRCEAERVRGMIEDELGRCVRLLNRQAAGNGLALLHSWAERIRVRERDRALKRLGKADERTCEVVDDLSRVLARRLLADATLAVRAEAEAGRIEGADALVRAITGEAPTPAAGVAPPPTYQQTTGDEACTPKNA
ncbi:MAG: glutamyl-tRNA reductase [Methanospirillum sp.]